jgi:uncharacterized protein (TIGR02246 family)
MGLISSCAAAGFTTLVLVGACTGSAGAEPPAEEVRRFVAVIAKGVATGDLNSIAALYAPTAILLAPNGAIIARQDGIRAAYAANQSLGPNQMEFGQIQVDGDDQQAVVVWVWTLTITPAGGPPIKTNGRSMIYMKHTPEGWRIFVDMYQVVPAS